MATSDDIKEAVRAITNWAQTYRQCANQVTNRAHDEFMSGAIDLNAYSNVAQQMIGVLQKCIDMTDAAANVLARVTLEQVKPIEQATADLKNASARIDKVQAIVTVATELVAAVAAVATLVAAPTLAGVAAAGAAVAAVADGIAGGGY